MNRDHAERIIRETLQSTGGNPTRTRQQIIARAMEDNKLLQELVAPHLTGIVAHAVSRVMAMKEKPAPPVAPPKPQKQDPAAKSDPFGMELLRAIALGNPAQFGLENASAPLKKQQASQRHVDAIKQMVDKGKKSR